MIRIVSSIILFTCHEICFKTDDKQAFAIP
jgi:hypothetical protein